MLHILPRLESLQKHSQYQQANKTGVVTLVHTLERYATLNSIVQHNFSGIPYKQRRLGL